MYSCASCVTIFALGFTLNASHDVFFLMHSVNPCPVYCPMNEKSPNSAPQKKLRSYLDQESPQADQQLQPKLPCKIYLGL